MKFKTHPDIRAYEDSVKLVVETRTNRVVEDVTMEGLRTTVTLDQAPSDAELAELDDIMAATERSRVTVNGASVGYDLPETSETDSNLPDSHLSFDQRIKELVGDQGSLGKNKGGVPPADVTPDTTGTVVDVQLPASASETAKQRTQEAMLAFGKIQI